MRTYFWLLKWTKIAWLCPFKLLYATGPSTLTPFWFSRATKIKIEGKNQYWKKKKQILLVGLHLNGLTSRFDLGDLRTTLYSKQHHKEVLLNSFHLNGHTLGFHPRTQKLELPCQRWIQGWGWGGYSGPPPPSHPFDHFFLSNFSFPYWSFQNLLGNITPQSRPLPGS